MARDDDRFDERNRYRDRGERWRGRDWGDADDYYGNRGARGEEQEQWRGERGSSRSEGGRHGGDWSGSGRGYSQHGAYDEGNQSARDYGEGMYNRRPGQQGQESFGGGGMGGQSGWGTGRGQNREGYSGQDWYGGGGSGGGFNTGSGYYGQGDGGFNTGSQQGRGTGSGYGGSGNWGNRGGHEQHRPNQWNAYQPGGYQQGVQNAGQWDRHNRAGEWGGNESMGHGDWGSGHQRGGGYQWQDPNAAENYRGSPWGGANYGSGQYFHGGGIGGGGDYGQEHPRYTDPASAIGMTGQGGYGGGAGMGAGGYSNAPMSSGMQQSYRGSRNEQQNNYGGMRNEPHNYGSIMQGQQSYTGRGPKGWRRSDERIQEDLSEQLERHPQIDASDIEVRVENGEVTLTGTAPDRQSKRLAEDVAESVWGVNDVQNQIKVKRDRQSGGFFSGLFGTTDDRDERDGSKRDRDDEGANTAAVANATADTTNASDQNRGREATRRSGSSTGTR